MLNFFGWRKKTPRIALALGAGGARGLAHIPVLETLDEMGITPVAIAGTSMGAVVGASYASGMSGKDIRDFALDKFRGSRSFTRRLVSHQRRTHAHAPARDPVHSRHAGAVRRAAVAMEFLPSDLPKTFEELKIPLTVVATDFWRARERDLRHGSAVSGGRGLDGDSRICCGRSSSMAAF